ncbi:MAG TPA: SIS domain-containing protein, partial [Hanamia sp.]|nr:SIS domain-containing protein [Hanamia sp.]
HVDKIGPVSTMAFITCVWMTVTTVAEILADRGVKLYIHPSHNAPGAANSKERLDEALAEYKRRVAGV